METIYKINNDYYQCLENNSLRIIFESLETGKMIGFAKEDYYNLVCNGFIKEVI